MEGESGDRTRSGDFGWYESALDWLDRVSSFLVIVSYGVMTVVIALQY